MKKRLKKIARKVRIFFRRIRPVIIDGMIRQGYNKDAPKIIIIEPTNICNLKCSCCPHGNSNEGREKGFMSKEIFTKILNNIDLSIEEICLYLHGEPMLNKDLDFFVSQIQSLKGVMATVFSNGYGIDMELLKKILKYKRVHFSFSMDISNKEWYEHIRQPAKYEKAVECLREIDAIFSENKRKYDITIIDDNETDKQALSETLFSEFKRLKTISFVSKFPWPNHFYTGDLKRIEKNRKSCLYIHGILSVFWTGDVSLCSFDYSGKMIIGNMLESKYSEIYNSKQAKQFRKYFLLQRWDKLELCKNCLIPRFRNKTRNFTK
jgi:radical SAM protein with 4Fe4S-binding SPASM domain